MVIEKQITENLKKCPRFDRCNQNLCPLDLELHLRSGREQDKCKWMREFKMKKINERKFIAGGGIMPNGILKFVPESNLKWLNEISQKRWLTLIKSNKYLFSRANK